MFSLIIREIIKNIDVTITAEDLKDSRRIVLDGISTRNECKLLMEIATNFAILGDGYEGRISPHTVMEKFKGITYTRVVLLTYYKMLLPKYLKIFYEVTEKVRKLVKMHFKLEKELFYSFTHLVCRSALPDSPKSRTDFSHKIHADNCIILKNMTCIKDFPAFTWRDYSAILYLNDEFEGGELIFSSDSDGKNIEGTVCPTCGRMVAFSSGPENLHGVKAVRKGNRCAIGMWFTHDEEYSENDRVFAQYVLENKLDHHLDAAIDINKLNLN